MTTAEVSSTVHNDERLMMLPQSSVTVTNMCETVHISYVNHFLRIYILDLSDD